MKETMVQTRDGVLIYARSEGPEDGPALVFSNSLGSNISVWDPIMAFLGDGLRIVRYDMRGHGKSHVPEGPYSMGQLVSDAEAVCDAFALKDVMFVGLSVGGMVAQGLAVKRPDLVRAMVLSNTAAKIGNAKTWADRTALIQKKGMQGASGEVLLRWFGRDFPGTPAMAPWRKMFEATSAEGYCRVCGAIAGTDFYTPTSGLRLPTLGIAGSEDGSTPPDLVRETVDLIPGSQFALIRRAGHLPCVEQPETYAELLTKFMNDTGHLNAD